VAGFTVESKTRIGNLALFHLGIDKDVSNVNTERSAEASALRKVHDIALRRILEDHPWKFATNWKDLGLVREDPNSGWAYEYRYPSDAVKLRYIWSGIRNQDREDQVPFDVASDDTGAVIWTDEQNAEIIYTKYVEDYGMFHADFLTAFSHMWAYYVAPRLTKGDPFKLKNEQFQLYKMELGKAKASDMNETVREPISDSGFIQTRSEG